MRDNSIRRTGNEGSSSSLSKNADSLEGPGFAFLSIVEVNSQKLSLEICS